jgi:type II secretory pathway component GspD/PulD (secretin)
VNLYIFLTPRIIRNPGEASAVTKQKRDAATYHHETQMEPSTFKYKEETIEVLKSRHVPEPLKEEQLNEGEQREPKVIE